MSKATIEAYEQVRIAYPEYFKEATNYALVTEEEELSAFEASADTTLGLVYENSQLYYVVDLWKTTDGQYYPMPRTLYKDTLCGFVVLPVCGDKFVLNHEFSFGNREWNLEFPRIMTQPGMTIPEHLEAVVNYIGGKVLNTRYVGELYPDSGNTGGLMQVYMVDIDLAEEEQLNHTLVSYEELKDMVVKGTINDVYSLSCLLKFICGEGFEEEDSIDLSKYISEDESEVEAQDDV
ncbi:MAG: hypothetical protein K6G65_06735 [Lachnospiraceae bacterium]|nr:hypothetical protein [Lachnospiraceae bacterium]